MEILSTIDVSPIAASIEGTIVFIIIAVASAIFNAVRKKDGASDDWSPGETPLPPMPPPQSRLPRQAPSTAHPRKQTDWEEELRRMLQGGASGPAQPSRPVPPVAPPRREPVPTPRPELQPEPAMSLPPVFQQEKLYKAHCTNCDGHLEFPASGMGQVIECPLCHQPTVLRPFQQTPVETLSHRREMKPMTEASAYIRQASQMDERVTEEMSDAVKKPVGSTYVQDFKVRSAENENVIALLRTPRTARQVIIASILLTPPKSLES